MKPEEYDEFIFDPTGFYLQKILAARGGVFEGPRRIAYLAPAAHFRLWPRAHVRKPRVRAALENS